MTAAVPSTADWYADCGAGRPPWRPEVVGMVLVSLVAAVVTLVPFSPGTGELAASGGLSAGQWQWPVAGATVLAGYREPRTAYGPGHRGVDLSARAGTVVRAAGDGRVGFTGSVAGVPVVTVLHAGGLRTTYEPVRSARHVGEAVRAGDPIGTVVGGWPHCAPRTCVHWGLRRGADYLDPLSLVGAGQVRLLPLDGTSAVTAASVRWVAPAAGGASVTATAGIGVVAGVTVRRRRRRRHLPPGVVSLAAARLRRSERARPDRDEVGVPS